VEAKRAAEAAFDGVATELREISRWMHDHPETAFAERETAARLVAFLRSQGFTVEHPAYGMETAFAARIGATGPEVVI
jgi:Metal-dependent amidase/aminoacylase/carboxypeptidase